MYLFLKGDCDKIYKNKMCQEFSFPFLLFPREKEVTEGRKCCVTSAGTGPGHHTCCSIDCLPRCVFVLFLGLFRLQCGFSCVQRFKSAVMPKVKRSKAAGGERPAALALAEQILQADTVRAKGRVKSRDSRLEEDDTYVDERLSRKILQQARIQQEELQTEFGISTEKKKSPVTVLGSNSHLITSL